MLNIGGASRNLAIMSPHKKNTFLRLLTKYFHQYSTENDDFYSYFNKNNAVLYHALNNVVVYYNKKIQRLFVPKFYHERKSKNFLKTLKFIGEWDIINKIGFSEFPNEFGRKLYEYQKDPAHDRAISLQTSDVDWPMPSTYFKSIGPTLRGFSFLFPNNKKTISDNLAPVNKLINLESGTEEICNVLSPEIFFPEEKEIREKITEYNATSIKNFINESNFLYDKSNLIKETFVTAINKKLSIYGSFSHFQGKTQEEEIRLLSAGNFLKFFIEKNTLKKELKFQLTNIGGKNPRTKDNKIYDFSITQLGKKRKINMAQPIETIVIRAQQNFEIAGGLNPIQIEIEDDRAINILKMWCTK